MKHGVFTTLPNPSNSHCNGSISKKVTMYFKGQASDLLLGIQNLVPRFNKYLDNAADYVEK